MAVAQIKTVGRMGIRCFPLTIEVDVSSGMPGFTIVGLPDTIVQESKERIRSAIKNSGASFPLARITVNLAPADIKKEGIGFDLPIAIGILAADQQIPTPSSTDYFYGEVGLHGELKPTRGVLSFVLNSSQAQKTFIPLANSYEAALVPNRNAIFGISTLEEVILFSKGEKHLSPIEPNETSLDTQSTCSVDFCEIYGQHAAKRVLEIAAAGHHNVLFRGSPGSGKTLLSRALPGIMPPFSRNELLETTQIYSIAGLLSGEKAIKTERPFRSPHHSASVASLVGGNNPPRPGEITLAHNGVLFLDEFAEFPRSVIEALRQPLEDKVITVARAGVSAEYPAHCLLITAINPCPCGYKDDPKQACRCAPQQILLYQKKLSGPILDRIDLHCIVPPVPVQELTQESHEESSASVRERVIKARLRQEKRFENEDFQTNSQLSSRTIHTYCELDKDAQKLLESAMAVMNISARGYHKILKISRTIADLQESEEITTAAVAEALQYRPILGEV